MPRYIENMATDEKPGEHGLTPETALVFSLDVVWGDPTTEEFTLGEFLGDMSQMTMQEIDNVIATELQTWTLEQVQDSAGYKIGD